MTSPDLFQSQLSVLFDIDLQRFLGSLKQYLLKVDIRHLTAISILMLYLNRIPIVPEDIGQGYRTRDCSSNNSQSILEDVVLECMISPAHIHPTPVCATKNNLC